MAASRFRRGAIVCAIVPLMSLAGCADQPSVLAPTTHELSRESSTPSAELNPTAKQTSGPGWTLYNSDFRHTDRDGGYTLDPQSWIELDVVAGEPVTVNWVGRFRGGAHLRFYRWTLDIADISDETPRIDEATDLSHWSERSVSTKSATVGPFAAGEQHFLFVEVADTDGLRSLATLHMTVVATAAPEVVRRH